MKMEAKNVLNKLGRIARFFTSPKAIALVKVGIAVVGVLAAVDELRSSRRGRECEDCED